MRLNRSRGLDRGCGALAHPDAYGLSTTIQEIGPTVVVTALFR